MTVPKIIENMEDLVRTDTIYTANLIGISKGTTLNSMCNVLKTSGKVLVGFPICLRMTKTRECKAIEKALENVVQHTNDASDW